MTYTPGLDIGAASIGWAMTTDNEISRLGSRIFPEGLEAKSGDPKNRKRREKRLVRRQIARKAQRRETFLRAFQILGWLPTEKSDLEKIWLEDPYALRKIALDVPLSKSDLARALFHLSKHRGFKSNRKTDTGEETLVIEETPEPDAKGKSKQPKKNLLRDGDSEKQGYGELNRLLKNGTV
jgi:CRISPR-associated endonuclease Csn1